MCVSNLEAKLERTGQEQQQAQERYRACLGEQSAKIAALYSVVEAAETAEKERKAELEIKGIAAENLQVEIFISIYM